MFTQPASNSHTRAALLALATFRANSALRASVTLRVGAAPGGDSALRGGAAFGTNTALLWMRQLFTAAMTAAILLALAGAGRAWAIEPWPQVPDPPKSAVQWVAPNMRVDGVPTRIMQFQSGLTRNDVVDYYRAQWSKGYPHAPIVRALGEASVISQLTGPYLMTVKVQDSSNGSRGLMSVAQVIGIKADRDPGELPLIDGAKVVSVVESDDPGKHSRQTLIASPQSLSSATQFYQASLLNAGWQQLLNSTGNQDPHRAANKTPGSFMAFARESSEMQLSVIAKSDGRGSLLLANLVTKDTGR